MSEKRFICIFDEVSDKYCVQDTNSLDIHPVADEKMGNEFAHLLNLSEEAIDKIEKENYRLKKENEKLKVDLKMARIDGTINRMAQRPMRW